MGITASVYRGGKWDSERLTGFHKPSSGSGTFLLAVGWRCHPWSLPQQTRNFQEELCSPLIISQGRLPGRTGVSGLV